MVATNELYEEMLTLLKTLVVIPSPSGFEDERAAFLLPLLKSWGFEEAYIDEAKNVLWKIEGETDRIILCSAHIDTVFPDRTPLPLKEDEENLYCPGIGDDAGCLVPMLIASRELKKIGIKPKHTFLFAANSCEEGLGNLKGIKNICQTFGDKIDRAYSFDGDITEIYNAAVGSHRYRVEVKTKGGHSYSNFGNTSAIDVLSEMIQKIYALEVPQKEGEVTTYNVGTVEGGTSVNAIAQSASMLCEYRSTDKDALAYMKEKFFDIFDGAAKRAEIKIELVGDRPCADCPDPKMMAQMTNKALEIQSKYAKVPVKTYPGSTDCNCPLSLGIPAIDVGCYVGAGAHTREEWLKKESLKDAYAVITEMITWEMER